MPVEPTGRTTYIVLREEGEAPDVHYVPVGEFTGLSARQSIERAVRSGRAGAGELVLVAVPQRSFRRESVKIAMVEQVEWTEVGRGIADLLHDDGE